MREIKTLCLVNKNFVKSFKNYNLLIRKIIKFSNKRLNRCSINLKPLIKIKDIKGNNDDEILDKLNLEKGEIIIYFIHQNNLKSLNYKTRKGKFEDVHLKGVADKKSIIISKFFPIKIPFLYKYGLKKLTLHEIGHMFGLDDTFFKKLSIMDYRGGIFASRFSKSERDKIKKYSKNVKKKIGHFD